MDEKKLDKILTYLESRAPDFIIFKKKSALQFTLKPATMERRTRMNKRGEVKEYIATNEGHMFLATAPAIAARKYDWTNQKVTLKLSKSDIGQFLSALRGRKVELYHDPHKGDPEKEGKIGKIINIQPGNDGKNIYVNISQKINGEVSRISSTPIDHSEAEILIPLLQRALVRIMNW